MKNIGLFIIIGLLFFSCKQHSEHRDDDHGHKHVVACADSVKDGVFIHISQGYNDPHRVLMAMKMASLMANDKDVLIYMDINSVKLLVKDAKDLTLDGFDSFQTYVKQLIDNKVVICVCPTCLKVAGFKADDLIDGVQLAKKDKFFNFTKGRIITFDY